MTNGWPAPASQELGANWVEVTARERVERSLNQKAETLKTWPATARLVGFRAMVISSHCFQVGVAFPDLWGKQPGSASHSVKLVPISNCRLPID